jgi:hypothetical protein
MYGFYHWLCLLYHSTTTGHLRHMICIKRTYHMDTYCNYCNIKAYTLPSGQDAHIIPFYTIRSACSWKDMVKIDVYEKISHRIGRAWEESASPPDVVRQWWFRVVYRLLMPKPVARTELPLSMTDIYRMILPESTCNMICRWSCV